MIKMKTLVYILDTHDIKRLSLKELKCCILMAHAHFCSDRSFNFRKSSSVSMEKKYKSFFKFIELNFPEYAL